MNTRKKVFFYLHIHKTGGSTLQGILNRNFSNADKLDIPRVKATHLYRDLPKEQLDKLKLVKGHFLYGLHELHPEIPAGYFTFMREPVDRVISLYYHVLRSVNMPVHDDVRNQRLDLEGFIKSGLNVLVDNGQTRFISGENPPFGQCTREMLEAAKRNIDTFEFVGIQSRYDESVILMGSKMNLRKLYYAKANIGKGRVGKEVLSQSTIDAIRSVSELDNELYDYALKKFERDLGNYSGDMERELKKLQFLNSWAERFKSVKKIIIRS